MLYFYIASDILKNLQKTLLLYPEASAIGARSHPRLRKREGPAPQAWEGSRSDGIRWQMLPDIRR
jgi:hypothetical protein